MWKRFFKNLVLKSNSVTQLTPIESLLLLIRRLRSISTSGLATIFLYDHYTIEIDYNENRYLLYKKYFGESYLCVYENHHEYRIDDISNCLYNFFQELRELIDERERKEKQHLSSVNSKRSFDSLLS